MATVKESGVRRRGFITLVGGAVAWPLGTRAQQAPKPARIGFLPLGSPSNADDELNVEAFRQGVREVGLIENREVVLEILWTSGDPERAVSELIQRGVDLLVPCGSSASVAARRHTKTIPILFISVGNPIGMGLVDSLSRPGGNATGFSDVLAALSGKYVGIARELIGMRATIDYL
jgi:putative ABC transport system substrate-binding protein